MCVGGTRQCAGIVAEGDDMFEALLPSGHVISSVLRYVWVLWEDPIDVSECIALWGGTATEECSLDTCTCTCVCMLWKYVNNHVHSAPQEHVHVEI